MQYKALTKYGVTLNGRLNHKGKVVIEVKSLLQAFEVNESSYVAWCQNEMMFWRPKHLELSQATDFIFFLSRINAKAADYLGKLGDEVILIQILEDTSNRIVTEDSNQSVFEAIMIERQDYDNFYAVASFLLCEAVVYGNQEAKQNLIKMLLAYNFLTDISTTRASIVSLLESEWLSLF